MLPLPQDGALLNELPRESTSSTGKKWPDLPLVARAEWVDQGGERDRFVIFAEVKQGETWI